MQVGIYPGAVFLPGHLLRGNSVFEWIYPDVRIRILGCL